MCDKCGSRELAVPVQLKHNVGMLVMRRIYTTEGELCRKCLVSAYLRHQLGNLVLGWWGYISFVMTFVFLVQNTINFISARHQLKGLERKFQARQPEICATPGERLAPFRHNVRLRLRSGEDESSIAEDLSRTHQVPIEAAMSFVAEIGSGG